MSRSKDPLLFTEHSPRFEVLPTMIVGILLNVGGRFLVTQAGIDFLWLDSVGTICVSLILGPWWGATTGLLGNALIGHFEESFLKFGAATIIRALAWGYVGRAAYFRNRMLAPRDGAHPFSVSGAFMVAAVIVGLTETLITASIKTTILDLTAGATHSYQRSMAVLYSMPQRPSPEHLVSSWMAYFVGDGLRQVTQAIVTGWLALVVVRNSMPLKETRTLQPPRRGFLVPRGSITVFLLADAVYILIILMESWDSSLLQHAGTRRFLITQMLSPMALGLLLLMYGVYCTDDQSLQPMRRWKKARERHYRAVANLQSSVAGDARQPVFGELQAVAGIVTLLVGFRRAVPEGHFGTTSRAFGSLVYIFLFLILAAYYFRRRRDFAARFARGLVAIRSILHGGRSEQARRDRNNHIGDVLAYALQERIPGVVHRVLRDADHGTLIALGAVRPAQGETGFGHAVRIEAHVLAHDERTLPQACEEATARAGREGVEGVILIAPQRAYPICLAKAAEASSETSGLVAVLSADDLVDMIQRRIAQQEALSVVQEGWLRVAQVAERDGEA